MSNASIKHGLAEAIQGFVNMVKTIIKTVFIMFAALGIFYTLQIYDLAPKIMFSENKPIYDMGAE